MYRFISPRHNWTFTRSDLVIVLLALVWTYVWKGIALWRAGRNEQKGWFVVLVILNTLGILEIVYLLGFQSKPKRYKG
jgi:hypothetical protein